MQPDDECPRDLPVGSHHSHQSVWPEPEGERGTHPVPFHSVFVRIWDDPEYHGLVAEHGENGGSVDQLAAGAREQLNTLLLTHRLVCTFNKYVAHIIFLNSA